jgi:hypothetical protein
VAPRTSAAYVSEWDTDANDIRTTSATAAARPTPNVDVRLDLYHRLARYEPRNATPDRRESTGGAVTLWTMFGVGWALSGTVGASDLHQQGSDLIGTYRASLSSPGRYPVTGSVAYARYPLDATAVLINREVYLDEWSASASWTPAQGWTVAGGGGTALFIGRALDTENRRVNGNLHVARRISRPFTLGFGVRFFGFERDLNEGYFDPDVYALAEWTARWLREWRHWSLNAEVAPGSQQVGSEGKPSGSFRGSGSVAYVLSPGRRIVLSGLFANTGLNQIAPGATADYRYRAVSLAGQWVF